MKAARIVGYILLGVPLIILFLIGMHGTTTAGIFADSGFVGSIYATVMLLPQLFLPPIVIGAICVLISYL